jgi:hypothetical protein
VSARFTGHPRGGDLRRTPPPTAGCEVSSRRHLLVSRDVRRCRTTLTRGRHDRSSCRIPNGVPYRGRG